MRGKEGGNHYKKVRREEGRGVGKEFGGGGEVGEGWGGESVREGEWRGRGGGGEVGGGGGERV